MSMATSATGISRRTTRPRTGRFYANVRAAVEPRVLLSLFDDVALHRAERAQELIFLVRAGVERVERSGEILDERVEVAAADAHSHMRGLHVLALVFARTAACLADLIDELYFEAREPLAVRGRRREELVDPGVGGHARHELVHNRGDGLLAAEAVVERLLFRCLAVRARRRGGHENGRNHKDSRDRLPHHASPFWREQHAHCYYAGVRGGIREVRS